MIFSEFRHLSGYFQTAKSSFGDVAGGVMPPVFLKPQKHLNNP